VRLLPIDRASLKKIPGIGKGKLKFWRGSYRYCREILRRKKLRRKAARTFQSQYEANQLRSLQIRKNRRPDCRGTKPGSQYDRRAPRIFHRAPGTRYIGVPNQGTGGGNIEVLRGEEHRLVS